MKKSELSVNVEKPRRQSALYMGNYISMNRVTNICFLNIKTVKDNPIVERLLSYAK